MCCIHKPAGWEVDSEEPLPSLGFYGIGGGSHVFWLGGRRGRPLDVLLAHGAVPASSLPCLHCTSGRLGPHMIRFLTPDWYPSLKLSRSKRGLGRGRAACWAHERFVQDLACTDDGNLLRISMLIQVYLRRCAPCGAVTLLLRDQLLREVCPGACGYASMLRAARFIMRNISSAWFKAGSSTWLCWVMVASELRCLLEDWTSQARG